MKKFGTICFALSLLLISTQVFSSGGGSFNSGGGGGGGNVTTNTTYTPDNTLDLGSADGGVTLLRPRIIYDGTAVYSPLHSYQSNSIADASAGQACTFSGANKTAGTGAGGSATLSSGNSVGGSAGALSISQGTSVSSGNPNFLSIAGSSNSGTGSGGTINIAGGIATGGGQAGAVTIRGGRAGGSSTLYGYTQLLTGNSAGGVNAMSTDTGGATNNLYFGQSGSPTNFIWNTDGVSDIGTPDGGTTKKRARDAWLSRDLLIGGGMGIGYQRVVATAAGSVTINNHIRSLQLVPAGTIATYTITMPAAPQDGEIVNISTSQTVTSLTLNGNSGQTISGAPSSLSANTGVDFMYVLSDTKWYVKAIGSSSISTGNLTDAGTDGIVITGGTGAVVGSGTSIAQQVATTGQNGYLASSDWNTFNGKQAAGSYITALTSDVTASGPGSVAATIATGAVTDTKASLANKPALMVVSTVNQAALSGFPVIDGQTPIDGSMILLAAQSTASQNGPWVTHAGAWTRPTWYPSGGTSQAFQFITALIRLGTVYQGSTWRQTAAAPITIDTTATTWVVTPIALNSNTVTGTLPAANLPNPTASTLGGIESYASVSHQWINTISTSGVPASSQPAFSDISGSLPLTALASQASNTVIANNATSSAVPTALPFTTVSVSNGTAPNNFSGMTGWWAADQVQNIADGAVITTLPDLSGNAFSMTPGAISKTAPTYISSGINGKPSLLFNGTSTGVGNTSVPLNKGAFTMVFVGTIESNNSASSSTGFNFFGSYITSLFGPSVTGQQMEFYNGGLVQFSNYPFSGSITKGGTPSVFMYTYDGTTLKARLNGAESTSAQSTSGSVTGFSIGYGPTTFFYNGLMSEAMLFNRALNSSTEAPFLEQWLYSKYGVFPAPVDSQPLVVFDGNSIMSGARNVKIASNIPNTIMAQLPGNIQWINYSFTGAPTSTLTTRATTLIDPLFSARRNGNVLVMLEGYNDASAADYETYVNARLSAGWKVVLYTPMSNNIVADATRLTFCSTIRAFQLATSTWNTGNVLLADACNDPYMGLAGQNNDTTYFYTDKTHPIDFGTKRVARVYGAQAVAAALGLSLGNEGERTFQGATINNTATNLTYLPLPTAEAYLSGAGATVGTSWAYRIRATAQRIDGGGTDSAFFEQRYLVTVNSSGVPTVTSVGTPVLSYSALGFTTANVAMVASTPGVLLQVTGETSKTVAWSITYSVDGTN